MSIFRAQTTLYNRYIYFDVAALIREEYITESPVCYVSTQNKVQHSTNDTGTGKVESLN